MLLLIAPRIVSQAAWPPRGGSSASAPRGNSMQDSGREDGSVIPECGEVVSSRVGSVQAPISASTGALSEMHGHRLRSLVRLRINASAGACLLILTRASTVVAVGVRRAFSRATHNPVASCPPTYKSIADSAPVRQALRGLSDQRMAHVTGSFLCRFTTRKFHEVIQEKR